MKAVNSDKCSRCTSMIVPGDYIEALDDGQWIHSDCLRLGDKLQGGWKLVELRGETLKDKIEGTVEAEGLDGKHRKIMVEGTDD